MNRNFLFAVPFAITSMAIPASLAVQAPNIISLSPNTTQLISQTHVDSLEFMVSRFASEIDDSVSVPTSWLNELHRPFTDYNEDYSGFF